MTRLTPLTHKVCTRCKENKTVDHFNAQKRLSKLGFPIYYSECKPCAAVQTLESWQRLSIDQKRERRRKYDMGFDYHKDYKLRMLYGMTLEEFDARLRAQDFKCEICSEDIQRGERNSKGKDVARVDHCHTTGKARGIICHQCNVLLGNAKDSRELLRNAERYLKKYDYL